MFVEKLFLSFKHTHLQSSGLGGAPVTQDHNQKLLSPLAPFSLLPALIEGEMSQQSLTEQNTLAQMCSNVTKTWKCVNTLFVCAGLVL